MSAQIPVDTFRGGLLTILTEVFEEVHGYVLDPGTSLFETLASISPEDASRPVSAQSAPLAAQVNHLRVYMDSLMTGIASEGAERPDWPASWQIEAVTDEEWADLIARLRASYERITGFARTFEEWDVRFVGGAFALVAHCAYHLGEIRQGIGVLQDAAVANRARA